MLRTDDSFREWAEEILSELDSGVTLFKKPITDRAGYLAHQIAGAYNYGVESHHDEVIDDVMVELDAMKKRPEFPQNKD